MQSSDIDLLISSIQQAYSSSFENKNYLHLHSRFPKEFSFFVHVQQFAPRRIAQSSAFARFLEPYDSHYQPLVVGQHLPEDMKRILQHFQTSQNFGDPVFQAFLTDLNWRYGQASTETVVDAYLSCFDKLQYEGKLYLTRAAKIAKLANSTPISERFHNRLYKGVNALRNLSASSSPFEEFQKLAYPNVWLAQDLVENRLFQNPDQAYFVANLCKLLALELLQYKNIFQNEAEDCLSYASECWLSAGHHEKAQRNYDFLHETFFSDF